jgi:1-acyl-sn-glycerol-3-phosphate acyltransferase
VRPIHILKAAGIVLNTLVMVPLVVLFSVADRDAKLAYRVVGLLWFRLSLWISGARVTVRGLENLDRSRSYVFMSNHQSNADIVAIAAALADFQLRWVAKKELLRVPVFGWGLRALKNVVIDRSNREEAIESYRRARERIERGISVMVFPEGTRGPGRELLPFKKGGFVLALETQTAIVPVAVHGTRAVLPRNGWQIEGGEVEVVLGRPVETIGRSVADRNEVMEEVRHAIMGLLRVEPPPTPVPSAAVSRA